MLVDHTLLPSYRFGAAVALAAALALTAYSQSGATPLPGDPVVFAMFLRFHHSVACEVPLDGATVRQQPQDRLVPPLRGLNLSVDDSRTMCKISASLRQDEEAVSRDASAYYTQTAKSGLRPETGVDRSFQDRRLALRRAAMARLGTELSPAGRVVVFNYVDGQFRTAVRKARMQ